MTHAESIIILSDDIRDCASTVRPQLVQTLAKMQGWLKDSTSACPRCQWTEAQLDPPTTRQWLAWTQARRVVKDTPTLPPEIPQSKVNTSNESVSLNPKIQGEISPDPTPEAT